MGASIYITDACPTCDAGPEWSLHVTYNLTPMLVEAGFGRWGDHRSDSPAEFGSHLMRLRDALRAEPERYLPLNPDNRWGSYDGLVTELDRFIRDVPWESPRLTLGMWL